MGLDWPKDKFVDKKGCKSTYLIENNTRKQYSKIDFEYCVYEDQQNDSKCDFGLKTDSTIYFIELKGGSEINKGFRQLRLTIEDTEKCFKGLEIKARLIAKRIPRINIRKGNGEYARLYKKLGKNLEYSSSGFTENI